MQSLLGFRVRTAIAGAFVLGLTGPLVSPVAAAPRNRGVLNRLEIWPGQRVLSVLPLTVNENFLAVPTTSATATPDATASTSGSNELAVALTPLISPLLSRALQQTGKFSLSLPYKFDPVLRRALAEQRIQDADVETYLTSPSLASAQNILSQLTLDQPGMIAQVRLENLIVGGTPAAPTMQLRMKGELFESGAATAFRAITVTSKPFGGKTPEDRLKSAADQAFTDIANAFIEPPAEFALPTPTAPVSRTGAGTSGANGTTRPLGGAGGAAPVAPLSTSPLAPPSQPSASPPNSLAGPLSGRVAPTIPPSAPPLGLSVPDQG